MSALKIEHIIKTLDKLRLFFALGLFVFIAILCSYKLIKGSIIPKIAPNALMASNTIKEPQASFTRPLVLQDDERRRISQRIQKELEECLEDEDLLADLQHAYENFFNASFGKTTKEYGIDSKRLIQWSLHKPHITLVNISLPSGIQDVEAEATCDIALKDPAEIIDALDNAAKLDNLAQEPSQGYFAYAFEKAIASGEQRKVLHCSILLKTNQGEWHIDEGFTKAFVAKFKSDLIYA